jgi:hypothetical protein
VVVAAGVVAEPNTLPVAESAGFSAVPKAGAAPNPLGCPNTLVVVAAPNEVVAAGAPNADVFPNRLFPSGTPPNVDVEVGVAEEEELENSEPGVDEPPDDAPKVLLPNAGVDVVGTEPKTLFDSPNFWVPQELAPEDDPKVGVLLEVVVENCDPEAGAPKPKEVGAGC